MIRSYGLITTYYLHVNIPPYRPPIVYLSGTPSSRKYVGAAWTGVNIKLQTSPPTFPSPAGIYIKHIYDYIPRYTILLFSLMPRFLPALHRVPYVA